MPVYWLPKYLDVHEPISEEVASLIRMLCGKGKILTCIFITPSSFYREDGWDLAQGPEYRL